MLRSSIRLVLLLCLATLAPLAASAEPLAWPVPDWETASPESQQMSTAGLEKVRDWLKAAGSKTGLVVRHGRIVGEWYFDDAKPTSKYLVFSTSKSFASTAAGLAIYDGKLTLETTVGEVLPDVMPEEKRQVTVRQLISMTTGVFKEPKMHGMEDLFTYALYKAPRADKPGEKWDYNNTGLAILSPVIKKATGQPLDQLLNTKVFQPIGIAADDWSWEQREGLPLSYSGLHITARSLARFGLLFLREGKWRDRSVVPAEWVSMATHPSQKLNPEYGFLWWNNSTSKKWPGVPTDAYAALGAFENDMLIIPSLDMIVIRQIGDDAAAKRKLKIGEFFKLAVDAVNEK
jgi:CubicO group peptidase (beta-lactamase class C family)